MISNRIDNVVHMPDEFKVIAPPAPISVKIELTRSCNYRCVFCAHSRISQQTGKMDWSLFEKIVTELAAIGVRELAPFFFGESFIDNRLPDAIRFAKLSGIPYVFLTTNGSMATMTRVAHCMEAGLNSLKFSLNYADANQLAELSGVVKNKEINFRRVVENVKKARFVRDKYNYKCGLYASYIYYDAKQTEKMQPVLNEVRPYLDEIYALPLYNQAATITKEGWTFTGGNTGRKDNPVPAIPCWVLFREAHINFDGTVCACAFSVNDSFIMGDLNHQKFMDIWHCDRFQKLRQSHLNCDLSGSVCDGCVIKS